MTSSWFHAPPLPSGASQIVLTSPPANATVLSRPPAKKPTNRESADQNGNAASSVPGTARGVTETSGLIHSFVPSGPDAVNARWRPSGDSALVPMTAASGGAIENRYSPSTPVAGEVTDNAAIAASAARIAPATPAAAR